MIEAGVPGYAVTQWHGLLAPRGTPRAVIDRLVNEIVKAVHQPEVASRLAQDGTEGIANSPQEFAAYLNSEREQWTKVAKLANIRSD
jgi:tripartite-type tricarboxylate transporter receptor subunit TctC